MLAYFIDIELYKGDMRFSSIITVYRHVHIKEMLQHNVKQNPVIPTIYKGAIQNIYIKV